MSAPRKKPTRIYSQMARSWSKINHLQDSAPGADQPGQQHGAVRRADFHPRACGAAVSGEARPGIVGGRAKPRGLSRLLASFGNSWKGFAGAWKEEEAFRQECLGALVVLPAGIYFGHTGVERALLVGPMLLVLIVELLNSAVEAAIDRIGVERNPLSGLAKDLGSAAVLMSFVLLAVNWVLVLADH